MDQTFAGDAVNEEARNKLSSPRNSLPMLSAAEERFDKYLLVIVPLVEDESNGAQIQAWHDNDPKSYRLRIVEQTHKLMKLSVFPFRENHMEGPRRTRARLQD